MSDWPRVILLGDSITQYAFNENGWGSHIAGLLQRKCDIFNRGFSGYTTQYIVKILGELINTELVQNVAAVTIFYGANDSSLSQYNSRQHVPLEKYEANLRIIVDRFVKLGVAANKIILIAPPPVNEKAWLAEMIRKGSGDKCDRSNEVTEKYAQACQKVAESQKCRFVNLWSEMMSAGDISAFLNDGLHFTEKGNFFLAKLLEKHIFELTKQLPVVQPLWNEFPL